MIKRQCLEYLYILRNSLEPIISLHLLRLLTENREREWESGEAGKTEEKP